MAHTPIRRTPHLPRTRTVKKRETNQYVSEGVDAEIIKIIFYRLELSDDPDTRETSIHHSLF